MAFAKATSFIRAIDFLASSPKLRINSALSYKTMFGGIISFGVIAMFLLSTIYFGADLLFRNEPISIASIKSFESLSFALSEDGFNIFLSLEDRKFTYYQNPKIYTVEAVYSEYIINEVTGDMSRYDRNLEITTCDNYYNNSRLNDISNLDLDPSVFFCIKPNQNISVTNYWGASFHSAVYININKCSNSSQNNFSCLPSVEIDNAINAGVLSLYAKNNLLSIDSLSTPIVTNMEDIFYGTDPNFTYNIYLNMKPMQFQSDSGFIMKDIFFIETYYIDQPHIIYYGRQDLAIAKVIIQGKPLGQKITRTYIKVQDVLTNIGGIIEIFIIIGNLMSDLMSKLVFYNDFFFNLKVKESSINLQNPLNNEKKICLKDNFVVVDKSNDAFFKIGEINFPNKPTIKIDNSLKVLKSMTLPITNNMYSINSLIKNCFMQLFGFAFSSNHLYKRKLNLETKLNKMLSIEVMLEKFYFVEILINYLINEEQQILALKMFPSQIDNATSNNHDIFESLPIIELFESKQMIRP